jgi:hypothetical protein
MDWWHALRRLVSRLLLPLEPLLFDSVQLLAHIVRYVVVVFELVALLFVQHESLELMGQNPVVLLPHRVSPAMRA